MNDEKLNSPESLASAVRKALDEKETHEFLIEGIQQGLFIQGIYQTIRSTLVHGEPSLLDQLALNLAIQVWKAYLEASYCREYSLMELKLKHGFGKESVNN